MLTRVSQMLKCKGNWQVLMAVTISTHKREWCVKLKISTQAFRIFGSHTQQNNKMGKG